MDRLDRYEARLGLLYAISHAVVESNSLTQVVDLALNGLYPLIPYWRASVALFHLEEEEVAVYAAQGEGRDAIGSPGERVPLSVYGGDLKLLRTGQPDIVQRASGSAGFRSRVLLPLLGDGNVFGSLNLASTEVDFFTADRLEVAREVANQLAVAVRQTLLVQRAHAAAEAKSAFLANMSHELRTPLNAIIGYTELLLESALREDVRSDLESVSTAATGLVALISDILDLSRVEAGHAVPLSEVVDIAVLLQAVEIVAHPLAEQRGNRLVLDTGAGPETLKLKTDPQMLLQILQNLVVNACKFTEDGLISVSVRAVGASIEFHVRDTGIGIEPELLPVIFDAFTRAHRASAGVYRGTGLGLALVQEFSQLLGGHTEVVSEVGVGTTFTLVLPRG